MSASYLANVGLYVPELIGVATMMALLFIESSYKEQETERHYVFYGAMVGLVAILGALIANLDVKPTLFFTNAVVLDSFGTLFKIIMVLGTMGAVFLGRNSTDVYAEFKSEFTVLCMGVLVGGMLLTSATNMLTMYLGVETLSILSYVMAGMKKRDERSSEAGLKYVLYGGIAAGIMLFGMAHIYGLLGSINFHELRPLLTGELTTAQLAVLIPAFLFFFAGIGYKIACVPFHMWSPDVYEGSPTPVTVFFATVPKMAGLAALVRITMMFFSGDGALHHSWIVLLSVVSALTMTVGNVSAIGQKSVKRMLAFSSIAQVGTILLGVVVLDEIGLRAVVFYSISYVIMTLVAFYIVAFVSDVYGNDHFERFNGLVYRYPVMAIALAIVMFSLTGMPPFAGFVAKFNILSVILAKKYYTLALIAVLNSVVSAYYYMKIIRVMIFKESESNSPIQGFAFGNQALIVALCVPVVVLGVFWERIMVVAQGAKLFIP